MFLHGVLFRDKQKQLSASIFHYSSHHHLIWRRNSTKCVGYILFKLWLFSLSCMFSGQVTTWSHPSFALLLWHKIHICIILGNHLCHFFFVEFISWSTCIFSIWYNTFEEMLSLPAIFYPGNCTAPNCVLYMSLKM